MLCEHWKDINNNISGKIFKIHPETCSVEMNWKVSTQIVPQKIKGLKMTQFLVNSNITAKGHIL